MNNIPQNIEIEEGCLGCAFLSFKALQKLIEETHEDDFYFDKCRIVYQYLKDCYTDKIEPDFLIASQKADDKTGVTLQWIAGLGKVTTSIKIDSYIKELLKLSQARKLIYLSTKIPEQIHAKENLIEIITSAETELKEIITNQVSTITKLSDMSTGCIDDLASEINVRKTGFHELDKILWGISPGELIILAALTSFGKSAIVGNMAMYIAKKYENYVLWFTLEMSKQQMRRRFISQEAQVDNLKIKMKRLDESERGKVITAMHTVDDLPIALGAKKNNLEDLLIEAKKFSHKEKISLIVVDYLQLIQCFVPGATLAQVIGKIVNELKLLAEELEVPIICLSQFNRGFSKIDERYPQSSDLKESSTIEQAADMIWLLHKYTEKQKEKEFAGDYLFDVQNLYRFIVDKNRDGKANFYINMEFIPEYTSFREI